MNKKGYVIWITGFPGSGKSKVSSMIHEKIENQFGKTIRLSGDDLRIMLNLQGYSKKKEKRLVIFTMMFAGEYRIRVLIF